MIGSQVGSVRLLLPMPCASGAEGYSSWTPRFPKCITVSRGLIIAKDGTDEVS